MARNPRRRAPRRAGAHRAGVRRAGMPPIGGDGVDLNSELTLTALRALAQDVERLTPDDRLETILGSVGTLVHIGELIGPQYREISDYMHAHDASEDHDERILARIEGLIKWIHQLSPPEIVSLVATSAALLDLIHLVGFDAPDEILELFADDDQPDVQPDE